MVIKEKLKQFALDPENPVLNFELSLLYYREGQYAAALNYSLRCSEISNDNLLIYRALMVCVNSLYRLKDRPHSTTGFILHAISVLPQRPEAWFLYLRHMEEKWLWQECYTYAISCDSLCNFNEPSISRSECDYPGKWGIDFIKAKAAYHIGRRHECRILLQKIVDDHWDKMPNDYKIWIETEIKKLGDGLSLSKDYVRYNSSQKEKYKFPFPGFERILSNYSKTFQDMFVLSVLKGKSQGTYLEIGSHDPHHNNNTALLEEFGWTGSSIEIEKHWVDVFNQKRKNKAHCYDATKVNYKKFLSENYTTKDIDFLQLDCEPSNITFEAMLAIPFDEYRFGVIAYEHDHCMDMSRTYREKSRRYLKSLGYELVVNDIGPNGWFTYEDWWVHPELVDRETIENMRSLDFNRALKIENYFLKDE
jgi:hypothetical protein